MAYMITTNNNPRPVIYGNDLTAKEREDFDYLTTLDLDLALFFRYRGNVYALSDFLLLNDKEGPFNKWDAYSTDSLWNGLVIKLLPDQESVLVGSFIHKDSE